MILGRDQHGGRFVLEESMAKWPLNHTATSYKAAYLSNLAIRKVIISSGRHLSSDKTLLI